MNLENRLRLLEQRLKPSIERGWQHFVTYDDQVFFRKCVRQNVDGEALTLTPRSVDYRDCFLEEGEVFSKADLENLKAEGWSILIIHYVKMAC